MGWESDFQASQQSRPFLVRCEVRERRTLMRYEQRAVNQIAEPLALKNNKTNPKDWFMSGC